MLEPWLIYRRPVPGFTPPPARGEHANATQKVPGHMVDLNPETFCSEPAPLPPHHGAAQHVKYDLIIKDSNGS